MKLFELAWRNMLRNRRRTALTLAAVAVGGTAIVMFGGYVAATAKALQTDTVRQIGHLQIMNKGYLDFGRGNPSLYAIRHYEPLLETLRTDPVLSPMLTVATPVLNIQGVAGNFAASTSSNFVGNGWQPADRRTMLEWDGNHLRMPPGASRLRDDQPESGVIGLGLAQLLGLCERLGASKCATPPLTPTAAGEAISPDLAALTAQAAQGANPTTTGGAELQKVSLTGANNAATAALPPPAVELLVASTHGAPSVVRMQVLRTERQGARELDSMYAGMPLTLAQRLLFGPNERGASAIVVQLQDTAQLPAARARIEALLAQAKLPLEVQDYNAVNPQYGQVVNMFTVLFRFITLLMGVVTLFSVANAVNMSISERVGEIGTLRALGFKQGHIRRIFLMEGGLIGVLGGLIGVGLGVVLSEYVINQAGWTWTPPGRSAAVPVGIDTLGQPVLLAGAVGALALLACASAWWPARRASKLEVVEALRHV